MSCCAWSLEGDILEEIFFEILAVIKIVEDNIAIHFNNKNSTKTLFEKVVYMIKCCEVVFAIMHSACGVLNTVKREVVN